MRSLWRLVFAALFPVAEALLPPFPQAIKEWSL
jgi:hypothetical protein